MHINLSFPFCNFLGFFKNSFDIRLVGSAEAELVDIEDQHVNEYVNEYEYGSVEIQGLPWWLSW